jgi:hypothetical protein
MSLILSGSRDAVRRRVSPRTKENDAAAEKFVTFQI